MEALDYVATSQSRGAMVLSFGMSEVPAENALLP